MPVTFPTQPVSEMLSDCMGGWFGIGGDCGCLDKGNPPKGETARAKFQKGTF